MTKSLKREQIDNLNFYTATNVTNQGLPKP